MTRGMVPSDAFDIYVPSTGSPHCETCQCDEMADGEKADVAESCASRNIEVSLIHHLPEFEAKFVC